VTVVLGALVVVGACGDDDSSADPAAFCAQLDRLATNDPFEAFGDRATPADIEVAFDALVDRSAELLEAAPEEARATARDFAESADALDDLLAGAAYDGSAVDARAYREEQARYITASERLERYLDNEC
jgi:hypothetical protein